ncbi:hypothetical protein [Burkholderia sp. BCC0405]|nr:hypothetical protein [Burkholderia sp. BCC0405]
MKRSILSILLLVAFALGCALVFVLSTAPPPCFEAPAKAHSTPRACEE